MSRTVTKLSEVDRRSERRPLWLGAAALCVALIAASVSASALTISIDPSEDPSYSRGPRTPMGALVSGCMARLFDAGHVATDAPVYIGSREGWASPEFGLPEARAGFVDYIIAIRADWRLSPLDSRELLPDRLEYRFVRVKDGAELVQGALRGSPGAASASADLAASAAGSAIAGVCLEGLGPRTNGGE